VRCVAALLRLPCARCPRKPPFRARPNLAPSRAPLPRPRPSPDQPLPFHYIEIATALFKHAGDAFGERRQRIYDLVETIRSVRFNKIERGLRKLDGANVAFIRLNNVSAMEARTQRHATRVWHSWRHWLFSVALCTLC
jgi:hypothetical protein